MSPIIQFIKWLNKTLEVGFARIVCAELYSSGVLTREEYLDCVEKVDGK